MHAIGGRQSILPRAKTILEITKAVHGRVPEGTCTRCRSLPRIRLLRRGSSRTARLLRPAENPCDYLQGPLDVLPFNVKMGDSPHL